MEGREGRKTLSPGSWICGLVGRVWGVNEDVIIISSSSIGWVSVMCQAPGYILLIHVTSQPRLAAQSGNTGLRSWDMAEPGLEPTTAAFHSSHLSGNKYLRLSLQRKRLERVRLLKGQQELLYFLAFAGAPVGMGGDGVQGTQEGHRVAPEAQTGLILPSAVRVPASGLGASGS